jgi:transposase
MAKTRWKLTDEQWAKIEPFLPKHRKSKKGGRPWANDRKVFEGILWILRTGATWSDLPKEFPSPSTCWRRLREWEEQDVWLDAWRAFLGQLDEHG